MTNHQGQSNRVRVSLYLERWHIGGDCEVGRTDGDHLEIELRDPELARGRGKSLHSHEHGGHQRSSEALRGAIRGTQRGHQRSSEVIRGHQSSQRSSEVIRGHQRSSEVIRGHQRSSEVIRGHQRSSEGRSKVLRGYQRAIRETICTHPA